MAASSYRDLIAWQRSIDLVTETYRLSATFPREEAYGLVGQMRRAAVSISSNIAEGYGRAHRGDYLQHLSFALGSLAELETQLEICRRLGYIAEAEFDLLWQQAQEVGRLAGGLRRSLQPRSPKP